ncbi:MAG: STAS domain-containing protein [Acidobacteriota bacterium]
MADMQIKIGDRGAVKVVELVGSVTLGAGDLKVRETIKELVSGGNQKIVLDLGEVPFMDSTGIGELVAAFTSARNRGATLKLARLTRRIKDILDIAQLSAVFESYESVEEAVQSF